MSGLFLNFFQVNIPTKNVLIDSFEFSEYPTRESFQILKQTFPKISFYRNDDKIIFWKNNIDISSPTNSSSVNISLNENPKILSKIFENAFIDFLRIKLTNYKILKNKHSNTWEIISNKDILNDSIKGLQVNRVVHFSSYFFYKDDNLLLGFTLSSNLRNSFTWNNKDFQTNGIDIKGLNSDGEKIFADRKSLKRFLETKGVTLNYDTIINNENSNPKLFTVINDFYHWINKHKSEIILPFDLEVENIIRRYLPFENGLIKVEIINKPQRYFYSNRKNIQNLRYYDEMVKAYQPFSLELYQNKQINIGVICPSEYQGETEGFIKKIESKLKETFHFNSLNFEFKVIEGTDLENYKDVLYDNSLLQCDLIYVIVSESQEKLPPAESPYYFCKAKFIGNGIPTQDVQIETIRRSLTQFTMTNIALNSYAKLGGTAWTIEKEDKLRDELVIGIGSTISGNGQYVLGIAQIFHNDGRYMTGDCSPLSSFSNYAENLENHLYKTLKPLVDNMSKSGTFRLIFHLFKSASEQYEIKAINSVRDRFKEHNFEFALVHLGYGHNFRLYNNDGKNPTTQGTYLQLSKHSALLHFVNKSDLPLKIDLDKRSTFNSLFYIAKQVYWFSHLSHRSYMPSKRTVTIMYPSLMARMTEELKNVSGWDYDRLKNISDKLWFI